MAWDCKECGIPVEEDNVAKCPECGADKMSWTMVADQTRTFNISGRRKKLAVLRGEDSEPGPWDASYEQVEVLQTDHAVAIPKSAAFELTQREKLPPPEQVLFVRLFPGSVTDLTVKLTVLYEVEEPGEHEQPCTVEESTVGDLGHHDARFLFVYGPEELPEDYAFPGVQVIDITEDTEEGFAPTVGVAGLGKKRKDLPIESFTRRADRLICERLRFHTDSGIVMPDGLTVIRAALEHARNHPEAHMLIAGHTDKSGSDAYNLPLSQARAKTVLDVVAGDEEAWLEDVARKNSRLDQDVRTILRQISELWDWNCDPGSVENQPLDDVAKTAIARFKLRFNAKFSTEHLVADDVVKAADEQFWKRVFTIYAHELAERLGMSDAEYDQLVSSIKWIDAEHRGVGFGESYPLGGDMDADRRIEFLYLDPEILPEKPDGDEEGKYLEALYDKNQYSFEQLGCPEPRFYGDVLHNVVFVIDVSGSMRPTPPKGDRPGQADRIGVAKRSLNRAILDLPSDHRFTVVAYSDRLRMLWEEGEVPLLKEASAENKSEASAWVNGLGAKGCTRSNLALAAALQAKGADDGEPKGIKFLSDGCPSPRGMPQLGTQAYKTWKAGKTASDYNKLCRDEEKQIISEVKANRGDWQVDTIGFFKTEDEKGALVEFMRKLAEENGGEFTHEAVLSTKKESEAPAPRGFIHVALMHPYRYKLNNGSLSWKRDGSPTSEVEGVRLPDRVGEDGDIVVGGLVWGTYTVRLTLDEPDEEGGFQEVAVPLTRKYDPEPHLQVLRFEGGN